MQKTSKNKQGKQQAGKNRPAPQPAGVVELTEQDLERVQGGQGSTTFLKITV